MEKVVLVQDIYNSKPTACIVLMYSDTHTPKGVTVINYQSFDRVYTGENYTPILSRRNTYFLIIIGRET
jgi:hypothetical protein